MSDTKLILLCIAVALSLISIAITVVQVWMYRKLNRALERVLIARDDDRSETDT